MDFVAGNKAAELHGSHGSVDCARIQNAVREILIAIGEDPDRDGLRETPQRFARALAELTAGLREDPRRHLEQVFFYDGRALVQVKGIRFTSLCEHHLLPFSGTVSITYKPKGDRVFGLSKLARIVDGYARRLQLQERLTTQIAEALFATGLAERVAVEIQAEHACMCMRGAKAQGSVTITVDERC